MGEGEKGMDGSAGDLGRQLDLVGPEQLGVADEDALLLYQAADALPRQHLVSSGLSGRFGIGLGSSVGEDGGRDWVLAAALS